MNDFAKKLEEYYNKSELRPVDFSVEINGPDGLTLKVTGMRIEVRGDGNCGPRSIIQATSFMGLLLDEHNAQENFMVLLEHIYTPNIISQVNAEFVLNGKPEFTKSEFVNFVHNAYVGVQIDPSKVVDFIHKFFPYQKQDVGYISPKKDDDRVIEFLAGCLRFDMLDYFRSKGDAEFETGRTYSQYLKEHAGDFELTGLMDITDTPIRKYLAERFKINLVAYTDTQNSTAIGEKSEDPDMVNIYIIYSPGHYSVLFTKEDFDLAIQNNLVREMRQTKLEQKNLHGRDNPSQSSSSDDWSSPDDAVYLQQIADELNEVLDDLAKRARLAQDLLNSPRIIDPVGLAIYEDAGNAMIHMKAVVDEILENFENDEYALLSLISKNIKVMFDQHDVDHSMLESDTMANIVKLKTLSNMADPVSKLLIDVLSQAVTTLKTANELFARMLSEHPLADETEDQENQTERDLFLNEIARLKNELAKILKAIPNPVPLNYDYSKARALLVEIDAMHTAIIRKNDWESDAVLREVNFSLNYLNTLVTNSHIRDLVPPVAPPTQPKKTKQDSFMQNIDFNLLNLARAASEAVDILRHEVAIDNLQAAQAAIHNLLEPIEHHGKTKDTKKIDYATKAKALAALIILLNEDYDLEIDKKVKKQIADAKKIIEEYISKTHAKTRGGLSVVNDPHEMLIFTLLDQALKMVEIIHSLAPKIQQAKELAAAEAEAAKATAAESEDEVDPLHRAGHISDDEEEEEEEEEDDDEEDESILIFKSNGHATINFKTFIEHATITYPESNAAPLISGDDTRYFLKEIDPKTVEVYAQTDVATTKIATVREIDDAILQYKVEQKQELEAAMFILTNIKQITALNPLPLSEHYEIDIDSFNTHEKANAFLEAYAIVFKDDVHNVLKNNVKINFNTTDGTYDKIKDVLSAAATVPNVFQIEDDDIRIALQQHFGPTSPAAGFSGKKAFHLRTYKKPRRVTNDNPNEDSFPDFDPKPKAAPISHLRHLRSPWRPTRN